MNSNTIAAVLAAVFSLAATAAQAGECPIYIVSGEIIEYASNCAVPTVHKTGDVAREARGTSPWWQNTGRQAVELIAVDIFPPQMKKEDHMM